MKVGGVLLYCPPMRWVGGELATLRLLAHAADAGHEVVVAVQRLVTEQTFGPLRLLPERYARGFLRDADVLVSHPEVGLRPKTKQQRIVLYVHNTRTSTMTRARRTAQSVIVTNTESTAAELRAFGVRVDAIVRPVTQRHREWPTGAPFVTMSNVCPDKGAGMFATLAAAFPDTPFLAVRGGYGPQDIPPLPNVAELGHGPMDVPLSMTRVLLTPSRSETYGMLAAETVRAGIPVLASDLPSHRDVLGESWPLLDVDDESAWVDALAAVLDDDSVERKRAKVRGRELDVLEEEAVADWLRVLESAAA